ncbi:MAG TPA: hypothetical protein VFS05_16035 [Gemmatimonadaceae bacterium]|nr:hypothetical protein [Gemmatimonadaceae bacterium]
MHTHRRRGARTKARPILLALALAVAGACDDPAIPNLNDPELPDAVDTRAQLQAQVSGLLAGDRDQHAFEILVLETMGRDLYRIDPADPRFLQMPLGTFSPGAFLVDFSYNVHYRTIRGAQALIEAVDRSQSLDGLPFADADKAATKGFARTMKALQYLRLVETRDTLGVPVMLGLGGTLDPIRCKPAVLDYVAALLDSAYAELQQGGSSFPFALPSGFGSSGAFDTPAGFAEFNRALAAKAHMYQGFLNYAASGSVDQAALQAALDALAAAPSLASESAPLRNGVYHVYTTGSGDVTNFLYNPSVYRANPRVRNEAEPGDARLSKIRYDTLQKLVAGDTAVHSADLVANISSPLTPSPIVLNEEMLLVQAEVLWGLGQDQAALDIANFVRTKSGGFATPRTLGSFATRLDLLRFILQQKRYSLLFESGARLIDYRMFGLFDELGPELTSRSMGERAIPFPQAEIDARGGDLACQP